jgi:hypothetical protein
MSTGKDTPSKDLGTFYGTKIKPNENPYRTGQDPTGTKKAAQIEAAKTKAPDGKTSAVTIAKPPEESALHGLTTKLQDTATAIAIGAVVIFAAAFVLRSALKLSKATEWTIYAFALIAWTWFCVTHFLHG